MKVVKMTTFDAVNNEIYLTITTFRFQQILCFYWFHYYFAITRCRESVFCKKKWKMTDNYHYKMDTSIKVV